MNRSVFSLVTILLFSLVTYGQVGGVRFEDSLSWQQVLAKAKESNKYIFVDCYTTWCAPCKYMVQNIFPLQEVGQYFNNRFISISIQMDVTKNDPDRIKSWYNVADTFAVKYGVEAYPTYLFFAPDGRILHRMSGMEKDPNKFISKVADAFDPDKQYYTVIGQYTQHLSDSIFLNKALHLAIALNDQETENKIADAYVSSLTNPFTKETLNLLRQAIHSTHGSAFRLFLLNPSKVDSVFKSGAAAGFLFGIVYIQEIDPLLQNGQTINWADLSKRLNQLCPQIAPRVILMGKIKYFQGRKKVKNFDLAMCRYMDNYASGLSNYDLNESAWDVFQVSNKKRILTRALQWSKRAIAGYPNVDWEFVDTYSNLLYKSGNTKEAIIWERKAIEIAKNPTRKKEFEGTLQKMEDGRKTWD